MLLVGLTGGIATGKTTVSTQLREELGVPVVDADRIARAVVEPGRPAYRDIVRTFGDQVLVDAAAHDDGEHVANSGGDVSPVPAAIDRAKLGRLVFGDETRRRQLNAITHPRIRWAMAREVLEHWWRGYRCASDWATLIAGDDDLCTQSCDDIMTHTRHPVVVVDAPLLFESKLDKWMDVTVVVEW